MPSRKLRDRYTAQLRYDCHMNTPFTAVSSIIKMSRWQERSSCYKNDHIQQKKGRRQRNRIAITLLTISLPLELRSSSIRPLNEGEWYGLHHPIP